MIKKYPFSPGISEGEALQKLSGNERVVILHATNIYQDAVNKALNCNHPRTKAFHDWLESDIKIKAWYEQNQDQIKLVVDGIEIQGLVFCLENEVASDNGTDILNCNHPRLKAFQNWLERDIKIKAWYEQNQDQIKLVEDGIEIQGLVFCLENEVASDNGTDIWNNEGHTYFTFNAAQRHAAEHRKRVPSDAEWQKLIDFLPANQEASFFKDVLKIPLAGYRCPDSVTFYHRGSNTYLWSSTSSAGNAYYRYLDWNYLTVYRNNYSQAYGSSVRCLIDTY